MAERYAIVVDGICMPSYDSMEKAQKEIDGDPKLKGRGAVATVLSKPPQKISFKQLCNELKINI